MRRLGLLSMVVVLAWAMGAGSALAKVGYINLQRLVNESEMGKDAREDIAKLRENKQKAVAKLQKEVTDFRDEINKNANMKTDERQKKAEELQKLYKEYQRLVQDAKDDIVREDRQLVQIILEKADGVLKTVAKKKGYTMILKDPNAVGYLDPSVDITDDILKELDKK